MTDDHVSGNRPAIRLSQPIIELNVQSELAEVRGGAAYQASDHAAKTLVKDAGLEVVLIALKAEGHLDQHRAHVPIVVQALEGEVAFRVEDREIQLRPGLLLTVAADLPHSLTARTEAAVLLTLG